MKRFFKFALVALATAAVAVACQKPEQQPEKIALKGISLKKEAVELAIGAKETLTVKYDPENATEKPKVEWSTSAPAVATVADGEVTAVAAGEATITAKAGSFTATCKVTVKGEEQPEPGDFTSPNWANIGAITNGNHTFKFTKDDKNAYFYTERPKDDRFGELWGDGVGYVYYAFDFDGDLTTGEELLGNGKYEYIAYIYCFGGSANAPEIKITAEGGVAPSSYSLANVMVKGSVDENGLKLEYAVPLSDLPQLPEKFTIYTWGNKSLSTVEYKYPYEAPAAPEVASWAEAEAAGVIHFFQYRANSSWTPIYNDIEGDADDFDNLTVANGVYTVSYSEASNERWQSQLYLRPNPEKGTLPLKSGKNYLVSLTFKANTTFGAFAKLTQYGAVAPKHEGDKIQQWENILLEANTEKTVAYVVEGVDCDNVNFVLDFGTHPENTTVEISNVKLEETDLPVGPVGDETSGPIDINWDYTPSAEYLAESNLWKAVDGDKVGFYYIYEAAGYPAAASDSYELLSFKESTYVLDCKAATESTWANQLFIYPKEGSFIALDPAKTYKVKITVCSNADYYGPFIKLSTYNPETANHEGAEMWALTGWPELINFKAGEPIVKEVELTGKEAQNIIWVMGLGGNPANAKIYIKDIIVEEVKEQATLTDLSTINALAANTEFELNAIVAESFKISDSNSAAIVTDGVNCFYLFFNPATNNTYVKGDFVNAKGKISIYNHLIESAKNPTVTVLEQGVTVPELLPIEIASFDTFVMSDHPAGLYTATGKYVVDGSYTNLKIDGDTKDASLSGNIDPNWDGKTVKVTGWFTGTSNNASHTYIRVVDIQEVGGSAGSEPTDLSALKANCYVISEAGAYKIPAVKGNSDESVGTVASAAIIWETLNSSTAPALNGVIAKVGVNDGFIVFETPATLTPGNALIAALDASENILWSWHIWIPKNAISSSQFGLGGQTLMDRNLGALEVAVAGSITPESQGMLYSWGRKDPFLGNAVIGEKASYAVAEGQASVTIGASGVLMTVAESIKNPTTFVQTGSDDNKDWCSESDVAATLWGETKTMYDPCPAGYQVPYNPWDDAKNGIWNLKADDAILTTLGFSKNADQHWFQMGDPATVFPICGYLDQDGYKNRGARAYYWSARSTGTGIANVIRVDSSNNKVTDERKSRAGNIRCVVSE